MSDFISSALLRRKKNIKKGIQFSIMVCGAAGAGRSTFINTLCGAPVLTTTSKSTHSPSQAHREPGIAIVPKAIELEDVEDGTKVSLCVVDTPGFGDNIDNEMAFSEILGYLEQQYDEVLAEETRIRRNPKFKDNRVHVLLYFIEPTGHGLKELDVELMKRLSERVNTIPCIGRSDSLTPSELARSKQLIREDIQHYRIPIYDFPSDPEYDDEETIQENMSLRALLPFSIVASEQYFETGRQGINGGRVLARQYPWGLVEVENPNHSDFLALKSALLGSHIMELKSLTHDILYENYRTERLSTPRMGGSASESVRYQNINSNNTNGSINDASTVRSHVDDSESLNAEELANHSYLLKEEHLAREEEKLREIEQKVQREINEKRQELLAREKELREIEARLARERSAILESHPVVAHTPTNSSIHTNGTLATSAASMTEKDPVVGLTEAVSEVHIKHDGVEVQAMGVRIKNEIEY
ncbi:Septin [Nadsonia fulvescens var. elongata DSM 6958]|uniref:Septin n=1 Tax=Nadsonia fulvescens var. elongata DSM 6958 TaxID=857566 RepID=A0A1E3PK70_9ASCO|nr:Septin [Nadsonia fulvescens var. elongata DSM 6958]